MINILNELLDLNTNNAVKVFGKVDAMKLCSSMTLFYLADSSIEQFELVIRKFFNGNFDIKTKEIINCIEDNN